MRCSLFLLLALAGCTNDQAVEARIEQGRLVLDTLPGESKCVGFLRVARGGETMWDIEAKGPGGEQRPCAARLPIAYGQLPPGFSQQKAAVALTSATYSLVGTGEKFLRGSFRVDGRAVANFAPNSREWCAAQYPGSAPNWLGQCVIDTAKDSQ